MIDAYAFYSKYQYPPIVAKPLAGSPITGAAARPARQRARAAASRGSRGAARGPPAPRGPTRRPRESSAARRSCADSSRSGLQGTDGERGWGGQAGVGEVIERAVVAGRARHHRAVLAVLQKDRAALLVRSTPRERTVCGPHRPSRDPRQTKAGERTREVLGEDECVAREARRNLPPRHRPQRPKPAGGPTAKNHKPSACTYLTQLAVRWPLGAAVLGG